MSASLRTRPIRRRSCRYGRVALRLGVDFLGQDYGYVRLGALRVLINVTLLTAERDSGFFKFESECEIMMYVTVQ